jgi:GDP-4-dehydro-6-deoxy-D-mannose reductase
MRVLITGANGFVGPHLAAALMALPDPPEIVAAVYGGDGSGPPGARAVTVDITDGEQTLALVNAEQPTHLVHLAGITVPTQAGKDVRRAWQVNAEGTLNVALAVRHGAPDCRLLFCSTAQVYGRSFRSGQPLTEDAPLDPENAYASSKAAADILVGQMAKDGLRAIRLRPVNHTGPGQPTGLVVPSFAAQIAAIERGAQQPVLKVGDLTMRRDFLDVRDVVDAYVRAIVRFDRLPNGAVYNLASGRAWAVETILGMLLELSSARIEVVPDRERMRPNETPLMVASCAAARAALDWAPRWPMTDTLKSVLAYYRDIGTLAAGAKG